MLTHYTMQKETKVAPYRIVDQEEIPYGYPSAGLHRQLTVLTNGGHCPDCGTWPLVDAVITILNEFSHPERIIAIAIDMWEPYKTAIETALPHVLVVIDAFHVIQASTKALDEVRKQTQAKLSKEQSLALKQDKALFTKPLEKLTEAEKEQIQAWQQAVPELAQAISLHQQLRALYRCRDFEEALTLLAQWERAVLAAALEPFAKLLKTIWNWLPEIMNRFLCRISNAKTEGKNNQIRAMNKQGFGYSVASLRARMGMKQQQTALNRWREYQDDIELRLA